MTFWDFYAVFSCMDIHSLVLTRKNDQYHKLSPQSSLKYIQVKDSLQMYKIMIMGNCYQLGIHRSHFCHNNNDINRIFQHINAPDAFENIVCRQIGSNNKI